MDLKHTSKEGNTIRMQNVIALNPVYESFKNIEAHDLFRWLKLHYNSEAEFNLGLSRIHLKRNNQRYEFTSIGNFDLNFEDADKDELAEFMLSRD